MDQRSAIAQEASVSDYFLALDGIPGDSTAEHHRGQIEVRSFSWGVEHAASPGGGGGGGAGRAAFSDLAIAADSGRASPLLFQACAAGQHIRSAVLVGERAPTRFTFCRITLSGVVVTGYHESGSKSEAAPGDSFTLAYERIEVTHIPQLPDGSAGPAVTRSWDVRNNRPG
jgi:type VI secretion system secreted protein Hcp